MSTTAPTAEPAPKGPLPLFQIVEAGLCILQEIDDAEGELSDDTLARLDALGVDLTTKAEAYAVIARVLREEKEACKRMAQPFLDKADRKDKQEAALKSRLKLAMELLKTTRAVGKTGGAAIQANSSPALVRTVPEHLLENEPAKHVPAEYLETVTRVRWDAVKKALDAGKTLTFAKYERGSHLRWK